jgi:diadenosine tetraphosphatase ApaH/serine/threonine PP2A family protein phosphatase
MRYGLFGDIHSNLEALNSVLERLTQEKPDRYLCLGDIVGYGADPAACIKKVRELGCLIIAGNHDFAAAGLIDADFFNLAARDAIYWTSQQLNSQDKEFLRHLKLMEQIPGDSDISMPDQAKRHTFTPLEVKRKPRRPVATESRYLDRDFDQNPIPNGVFRTETASGSPDIPTLRSGSCFGGTSGSRPRDRSGGTSAGHSETVSSRRRACSMPQSRPPAAGELLLTGFTIVHSSPYQAELFEYIQSNYDLILGFQHQETPLCFVGHSHLPMGFILAPNETTSPSAITGCPEDFVVGRTTSIEDIPSGIEPDISTGAGIISVLTTSTFNLKPHHKMIINIGSVGQPRNEDPRACYAVYDEEIQQVRIGRVEYDVEKTAEKIIRAGLPASLAERLIYGR